jgi:hypothetical protein
MSLRAGGHRPSHVWYQRGGVAHAKANDWPRTRMMLRRVPFSVFPEHTCRKKDALEINPPNIFFQIRSCPLTGS